jgi:hypothetical protein
MFEIAHYAVLDFACPMHMQNFGAASLKRDENRLEVGHFDAFVCVTVSFVLSGNLSPMPVLFE